MSPAGPVSPGSTVEAVRDLWRRAAAAYPPGSPGGTTAAQQLARLASPLRVAVAGMVKAGKSTLVNALIGEEIAPTDAGERTRVLTWYEHAATPRVRMTMAPGLGGELDLPVHRDHGRLVLDLAGRLPQDVERLVVQWPSPALRATTLVDTPGLSSLTAHASTRTAAFVTPAHTPSAADAVLYLMRHLHSGDVRFLESFRDTAAGASAPSATIAVLSRADEVGAGRIDALLSAGRVAARYRAEPVLRALCQTVVPVAGLLGASAATLRQEEFVALRALAAADRQAVADQLLSADRFVAAGRPSAQRSGDRGPSDAARAGLLERYGVFGVRLAVTLLRGGIHDPTELARDLVRRSGVDELRQLLAARFAGRAGALKARTAVLALDQLLRTDPPPTGGADLARDLERVRASAHDLRELAVLAQLDEVGAALAPEALGEAEALLGGLGGSPRERLRLPADAPDDDARASALAAVARWRTRAARPLQARGATRLCADVVRSAEGVVAALARP